MAKREKEKEKKGGGGGGGGVVDEGAAQRPLQKKSRLLKRNHFCQSSLLINGLSNKMLELHFQKIK
jgi:hypothetical protein